MKNDNYIQRNKGRITHSKLMDFKFCPYLYKLRYLDESVPKRSNEALLFGSAFDLYIQSKKEFEQCYMIVATRFDAEKKIESTQEKIEELEKKEKLTKLQSERLTTLKEELKELESQKNKNQLTLTMGKKLTDCDDEFKRQDLHKFSTKHAQIEIEIEYKGQKIGGTLDQFDKDKGIISDIKTACSLDGLRRKLYGGEETALDKYKSQLAFYQFLVQVKHEVICDGEIQVITKEEIPKAEFFRADKKTLQEYRPVLLRYLDEMIETIETGIYPTSDTRDKCLNCEAYGVCPYSIQKEYTIIT